MDMAGVRLGERVVQAGMGNPRLFAKLAGKAGLSGRACAVVDSPEAAQPLQAAAAAEGVLIEVLVAKGPIWPLEDGSFDVGIVDGNALLRGDAAERASRLAEVRRTVRPSGRVLVIRSAPLALPAAWDSGGCTPGRAPTRPRSSTRWRGPASGPPAYWPNAKA